MSQDDLRALNPACRDTHMTDNVIRQVQQHLEMPLLVERDPRRHLSRRRQPNERERQKKRPSFKTKSGDSWQNTASPEMFYGRPLGPLDLNVLAPTQDQLSHLTSRI
jgi:hypothetical protein